VVISGAGTRLAIARAYGLSAAEGGELGAMQVIDRSDGRWGFGEKTTQGEGPFWDEVAIITPSRARTYAPGYQFGRRGFHTYQVIREEEWTDTYLAHQDDIAELRSREHGLVVIEKLDFETILPCGTIKVGVLESESRLKGGSRGLSGG
jgi:hypothetical protein